MHCGARTSQDVSSFPDSPTPSDSPMMENAPLDIPLDDAMVGGGSAAELIQPVQQMSIVGTDTDTKVVDSVEL